MIRVSDRAGIGIGSVEPMEGGAVRLGDQIWWLGSWGEGWRLVITRFDSTPVAWLDGTRSLLGGGVLIDAGGDRWRLRRRLLQPGRWRVAEGCEEKAVLSNGQGEVVLDLGFGVLGDPRLTLAICAVALEGLTPGLEPAGGGG